MINSIICGDEPLTSLPVRLLIINELYSGVLGFESWWYLVLDWETPSGNWVLSASVDFMKFFISYHTCLFILNLYRLWFHWIAYLRGLTTCSIALVMRLCSPQLHSPSNLTFFPFYYFTWLIRRRVPKDQCVR